MLLVAYILASGAQGEVQPLESERSNFEPQLSCYQPYDLGN